VSARTPPGVLLQTRVEKTLAYWIDREAQRGGLSVAGWLRATLIARRNSAKGLRSIEERLAELETRTAELERMTTRAGLFDPCPEARCELRVDHEGEHFASGPPIMRWAVKHARYR
jgi:hypothetical protein